MYSFSRKGFQVNSKLTYPQSQVYWLKACIFPRLFSHPTIKDHRNMKYSHIAAVKFPFSPHKFIWILPCSLSSSKMLPLKTSVIQSDSIPERQTKIQGDSSATCSLLLLIKMLELLVCIHCNLWVWHATQTISSCQQNHQGSHFKWQDRSFLAFGKENTTKQNKGMQKHLCYYFFQGERYSHSF